MRRANIYGYLSCWLAGICLLFFFFMSAPTIDNTFGEWWQTVTSCLPPFFSLFHLYERSPVPRTRRKPIFSFRPGKIQFLFLIFCFLFFLVFSLLLEDKRESAVAVALAFLLSLPINGLVNGNVFSFFFF